MVLAKSGERTTTEFCKAKPLQFSNEQRLLQLPAERAIQMWTRYSPGSDSLLRWLCLVISLTKWPLRNRRACEPTWPGVRGLGAVDDVSLRPFPLQIHAAGMLSACTDGSVPVHVNTV